MKISTSLLLRRMSRAVLAVLATGMVVVLGPVSPASALATTVSSLSFTSSAGTDNTYVAGDTISVTVVFSLAVDVVGSPRIPLVGLTNKYLAYASGTGTASLVFSYTVVSGDTDTDGVAVGASSLELNSGTIKNGTDPATLTHGAIAASLSHLVDTTAPTFVSAATNTAGTTLTLTYNGALLTTTAATSTFAVVAGGSAVTVSGVTVSGSTVVLTLGSTIQSGQTVTVAYTDPSGANDANAVQDLAGNDAVTLATTAVTSNSTADTIAPTVTRVSSSTANGTYGLGSVVSIQVTFSEAVSVVGTPQLVLELGSADRAINYSSGSGTTILTFNYTVSPSDTSTDLDYGAVGPLALNGGTIRDAALNNAVLTLATPGAAGSLGANKAIVINTTATATAVPTITSVSSSSGPAAGGTMVTLTGTNLTGTTSVTFDGMAGTSITNVSATSVTVVTPAHAAGAVNVVLTTSGGSVAHIGGFAYVAAPTTTTPTTTVPTASNNILRSAAGTPVLINKPPLRRIAEDIELAVRGNRVTLAIQSQVLLNTARVARYGIVLRSVKGGLVSAKTITFGAKGSIKFPKFNSVAVGRYRIQITATNIKGKQFKWTSPIVRITG